MAQNSFLFIPDISGFTEFVSGTEISHSKHIIAELLELMIDANTTDLVLSEIEGDALLFYRLDGDISLTEIIQQAQSMYLAFHTHLENYSHQRICPCGACKTASDLKLKIVIHYGDFEELQIKDRTKLHGENVIIAHRLLKNNIDGDEYILVSGSGNTIEYPNLEAVEGKMEYDSIGEVDFRYADISGWRDQVVYQPDNTTDVPGDLKYSTSIFIDADPELIMPYLFDFQLRIKWSEGVDRFQYDEKRVNRSGDFHQCIIGNLSLNVESIVKPVQGEELIYGERSKGIPFFEEVVVFFVLNRKESGTHLRFEVYNSYKNFLGKLFHPIWLFQLKKGVKKSLIQLKQLVEEGS